MRLHDSVAHALAPGAGEFAPLFADGDVEAASNWCSGFLAGSQFEADAWADLVDERPKWFAPILGLGLEDEEGPRPRKGQLDRWTRNVGPAVAKIHAHWFALREAPPAGAAAAGPRTGSGATTLEGAVSVRAERAERAERAPGRNDPCPCGSGRKYKRCCGAAGAGSNGSG